MLPCFKNSIVGNRFDRQISLYHPRLFLSLCCRTLNKSLVLILELESHHYLFILYELKVAKAMWYRFRLWGMTVIASIAIEYSTGFSMFPDWCITTWLTLWHGVAFRSVLKSIQSLSLHTAIYPLSLKYFIEIEVLITAQANLHLTKWLVFMSLFPEPTVNFTWNKSPFILSEAFLPSLQPFSFSFFFYRVEVLSLTDHLS